MAVEPAIFIDKDGTLIENVPYNVDPALVRLSQHAVEALRLLKPYFEFIVISNQDGVAHGYYDAQSLRQVEMKIAALLGDEVNIKAYHYCFHHPEGEVDEYRKNCNCRKPLPGMLLRAAQECQIDLAQSWMIGDILNDVEAGKRAGCRAVLIDNGNETEWFQHIPERKPDAQVTDWLQAAHYILKNHTPIS